MDASAPVTSRIESNVGFLVLNRPEALNAFNLDLGERFLRIMDAFQQDEHVRVIVIRGEGRVFSAGGDVKEMLRCVKEGHDRATYFREPLAAFAKMVLAVRGSPKPVVAAVHGAVAGVAFNLMLACDLVVAEENTRFQQAFVKLGLSPDGGGTWHLARLLGHARACELTLLPTELDARQAQQWGLINWVVRGEQFEARLQQVAAQLADGPADAIRQTKALLQDSLRRDLSAQMDREQAVQIDNAGHRDFEEGLAAFVDKRPAQFRRGRS